VLHTRAFHVERGGRATIAMRLSRPERRSFARHGRLAIRVDIWLSGALDAVRRRLTVRRPSDGPSR
jgi:hypothetical protein